MNENKDLVMRYAELKIGDIVKHKNLFDKEGNNLTGRVCEFTNTYKFLVGVSWDKYISKSWCFVSELSLL
jgi:hypothetical protein